MDITIVRKHINAIQGSYGEFLNIEEAEIFESNARTLSVEDNKFIIAYCLTNKTSESVFILLDNTERVLDPYQSFFIVRNENTDRWDEIYLDKLRHEWKTLDEVYRKNNKKVDEQVLKEFIEDDSEDFGSWTPSYKNEPRPIHMGAEHNYTIQGLDESNTSTPYNNSSEEQQGGTHYKKYKIGIIDFINKNHIPFMEANVIKYVCRHSDKDGLADIDKAIHYLNLIKDFYYGENGKV